MLFAPYIAELSIAENVLLPTVLAVRTVPDGQAELVLAVSDPGGPAPAGPGCRSGPGGVITAGGVRATGGLPKRA